VYSHSLDGEVCHGDRLSIGTSPFSFYPIFYSPQILLFQLFPSLFLSFIQLSVCPSLISMLFLFILTFVCSLCCCLLLLLLPLSFSFFSMSICLLFVCCGLYGQREVTGFMVPMLARQILSPVPLLCSISSPHLSQPPSHPTNKHRVHKP
jgi:hypothetical protein